jgi:hypothetical protein
LQNKQYYANVYIVNQNKSMSEAKLLPSPLTVQPSPAEKAADSTEWSPQFTALYETVDYSLRSHGDDGYRRVPTAEDISIAANTVVEGGAALAEGLSDERSASAALDLLARVNAISYRGGAPAHAVAFARAAAQYQLVENLGVIHETIERSGNKELLGRTAGVVHESLHGTEYEHGTTEGVSFLNHHFETIARGDLLQHARKPVSAEMVFGDMLRFGDDEERRASLHVLDTLAREDNPDTAIKAAELMSGALGFQGLSEDLRTKMQDTSVRDFLARYGIDYQEAHEAWGLASGFTAGSYEGANLKLIAELEKERKGICKVLTDKEEYGFDLINFARYPKQMLIDQYDFRDDTDSEYVHLATSAVDGLGTMWRYRHGISRLYETAAALEEKSRVRVRAYEVSSKFGLGRAWVKAARKYGPMSGRVVIAHGSHEGIGLGKVTEATSDPAHLRFSLDNSPAEVLTKYDFDESRLLAHKNEAGERNGPATRTLKRLSVPGCETIVISCETGATGGVVERISRVYNQEAITAPSVPAGLQSVEVSRTKQGKVHLEVAYEMPSDGEKRRFIGGAVVPGSVEVKS